LRNNCAIGESNQFRVDLIYSTPSLCQFQREASRRTNGSYFHTLYAVSLPLQLIIGSFSLLFANPRSFGRSHGKIWLPRLQSKRQVNVVLDHSRTRHWTETVDHLAGIEKAAAVRLDFKRDSKNIKPQLRLGDLRVKILPKTRALSITIRLEWLPRTAIMSAEKRPASDEYGSSQMLVKRPNLGKDSKAVTVASGSGGNGALTQAVCITLEDSG
jgi:hypothetical protein